MGKVVLLQDWDSENEEGAAKYWELFLDLLMVAAASAIAEGFQEDEQHGIGNFILFYFLIVNGWMLYTHHVTTRFEDSSFLHSVILFVYVLGFAVCITNANVETIQALAIGALLQRVSILVIYGIIHQQLPRARDFAAMFLRYLAVSTVFLMLSAIFESVAFMWVATLIETFHEFWMMLCSGLRRDQYVPINIEHSKDRLGILLLIMLGETVISSTIEFRRLTQANDIEDFTSYYMVLFWALILVFFYNQLYFCMNPPIAIHAFRRSKLRGSALLFVHKLMCGSVLAVGTSVKFSIAAVATQTELDKFGVRLWSCSVGCSIMFLFGLRLLHYWGIYPRGSEPPNAIRLMYTWWAVFASASLVPFTGLLLQIQQPICSISMYSSFLFFLCLVESTFTHILEPYLLEEAESTNQHQPLSSSNQPVTTYDAT